MEQETIEHLVQEGITRDCLVKYLLIKTAPVFAGVKPAVLIRFTVRNSALSLVDYNLFKEHQERILSVLGLDYIILKEDDRDLQVLFYDHQALSNVLESKDINSFLTFAGYGPSSPIQNKLLLLKSRFTGLSFPHEIGVFLGYPLKDVKGFVSGRKDHVKLPRCMWRVFDNPQESLEKMSLFRKAEEVAFRLIADEKNIANCAKCVRTSVGQITRSA